MEWNGKRMIPVMLILVASLFFVPGMVMAETIGFEPSAISVKPGDTVTVDLVLADAPGGLSGFRTIVLLNPEGVAKITSVSFPEWAGFASAEGVPGERVKVTSVDLYSRVEANATGVVLATLTVTGVSDGTVTPAIQDLDFDDDDNLPGSAGSINSPSSGSGSSSSSSSSSGSGSTAGSGTISPGSTVRLPVNQAGQTTPVLTNEPVPEQTTPVTTGPPPAASPAGPGIPFVSVQGMAVFLATLVIMAAWFRKREGGI